MRELPQSFWDALDETPQRRAGGFVVGFAKAGKREFRSRSPRFPRLERCRNRLAILEHLVERHEREERP